MSGYDDYTSRMGATAKEYPSYDGTPQLANNQLHPSMSQMPILPAGLNLTMNSINQMQGNKVNHGMTSVMYANNMEVTPVMNVRKTKKDRKVNKDGIPAPKRATTAYINFTQWYREELKKSGRTIPKISEFGKECAGKWNLMSDEEKRPFIDEAAKDRDRYKKEMAVYKPGRDANKPKRPGTAFMLFMGDFRKEMAGKEPEGGVAALAKLGGERWRSMSDEDKRPYIERQSEEKIRYEASMEDYRRKSAANVTLTVEVKPQLLGEGSEGGSLDSDSGEVNQEEMKSQSPGFEIPNFGHCSGNYETYLQGGAPFQPHSYLPEQY